MEAGAEIPHLTERSAPDGKSYPASRPAPKPEPAPGITSEEVDDLNQLPTEQPTMEQPQPTPGGAFQAS